MPRPLARQFVIASPARRAWQSSWKSGGGANFKLLTDTMKAKVLKTERDYRAALAHVERLMEQTSTDEAELELWSLLVANYEEAHFPLAAPDPIEAIRFRMDQAGR